MDGAKEQLELWLKAHGNPWLVFGLITGGGLSHAPDKDKDW